MRQELLQIAQRQILIRLLRFGLVGVVLVVIVVLAVEAGTHHHRGGPNAAATLKRGGGRVQIHHLNGHTVEHRVTY